MGRAGDRNVCLRSEVYVEHLARGIREARVVSFVLELNWLLRLRGRGCVLGPWSRPQLVARL